MTTPKPREPKKSRRPKQDLDEEWPGLLWTALALDRLARDREEKSWATK